MSAEIKRRRLRRTSCIDCSAELTDENGYRKSGRSRGWHSLCRKCRPFARRRRHDKYEAERRLFVTRDVCDICKQPERATRNGVVRLLNKDHDHNTGEWRGLLCSRCNSGIGLFRDNTELLQRAIEYLQDPPGLILLEDEPPESRQAWRQNQEQA